MHVGCHNNSSSNKGNLHTQTREREGYIALKWIVKKPSVKQLTGPRDRIRCRRPMTPLTSQLTKKLILYVVKLNQS
jgi:hypothetical protein